MSIYRSLLLLQIYHKFISQFDDLLQNFSSEAIMSELAWASFSLYLHSIWKMNFQLNLHNSSSFLNVINKNIIKIRINILTRCLLTNITTLYHLTPEAYSLIQIKSRGEGNLLTVQSQDDHRNINLISAVYENYNL